MADCWYICRYFFSPDCRESLACSGNNILLCLLLSWRLTGSCRRKNAFQNTHTAKITLCEMTNLPNHGSDHVCVIEVSTYRPALLIRYFILKTCSSRYRRCTDMIVHLYSESKRRKKTSSLGWHPTSISSVSVQEYCFRHTCLNNSVTCSVLKNKNKNLLPVGNSKMQTSNKGSMNHTGKTAWVQHGLHTRDPGPNPESV